MISTLVLLAQLAGGAVQPIAAELPTCGPALEHGTVCVWRTQMLEAISTDTPQRTIPVAIMWGQPEATPNSRWFARNIKITFVIDFDHGGQVCSTPHEAFRFYHEFHAIPGCPAE